MADIEAVETIEPGRGEQRGLGLALGQLAQPGVDIPPEWHDRNVRTQMAELRGAAWRGGADARILRQRGDALRPHQPIANIGAGQHRGNADRRGADRLDVLHRMDRKVDCAVEQRAVELLGPQRLAANLGQRAVLHAVAGGLDGDDRHGVFGPPMRGAERGGDHVRLHQSEGRSARAEAQGKGGLSHRQLL